MVVLPNAASCGGTDDGGRCNCKSTNPVCGATLDLSCKADPSAIYNCPNGNGTKYEGFQICSPGTKCITGKDGNASCGSDTCRCVGSRQRCSSHFPEKCGLQKNSIYQCSTIGEPQLVSSCGDDKVCITLRDGAICKSKDCTCTVDGTVCGESFHPSCRLSATSLYTCKTGQAPVLSKNCWPNRCTSTVATAAATAVFEAADAMDSCSDPLHVPPRARYVITYYDDCVSFSLVAEQQLTGVFLSLLAHNELRFAVPPSLFRVASTKPLSTTALEVALHQSSLKCARTSALSMQVITPVRANVNVRSVPTKSQFVVELLIHHASWTLQSFITALVMLDPIPRSSRNASLVLHVTWTRTVTLSAVTPLAAVLGTS